MKPIRYAPFFLLLALTLLLPLALAGSAHAQEGVFTAADRATLSAQQRQLLEAVEARPTTVWARLVRISADQIERSALTLNLTDDLRLRATAKGLNRRSADDFGWSGTLEGRLQPVFFAVNGRDVVGMIHTEEAVYMVQPLGDGLHALIRLDQSAFPPDHPPGYEGGGPESTEGGDEDARGALPGGALEAHLQANAMQGDPVIDILVVYTSDAAGASGNIGSVIDGSIQGTNTSLSLSLAPATVAKVHQAQVSYQETGSAWTDVLNLAGQNDGELDVVHSLRTQYGADVVVLLVNSLNACGIARDINASSSYAFAVVRWDCAVGNYTFAHEIGHLVGARHNRECDSNLSPYPYGHGYVYNPANWRTVMATSQSHCPTSANRIPYWSNPEKTYGGVPMGTVQYEDNVRVWEERAATVAAFQTTPPPPEPLTASVSGKDFMGWKESGTFTCHYDGGSGTPAFRWYRRAAGDPSWFDTGVTAQAYAFTMTYTTDAELRCRVTRGTETAYATHTIYYFGSAARGSALPEAYALEGASPNPVRGRAEVAYDLPEAASVTLVAYDVLGREVAHLAEGRVEAGRHRAWFDGSGLPSGVYVVRLEARGAQGSYQEAVRVTVVR